MNREEILARSRKQSGELDERVQYEMGHGFGVGGIAVAVLCILFSILRAVRGESFYEFGVILFGYIAACSTYNFFKTKNKIFLPQSIATALVTIAGLIVCIVKG